jgi:hypothetical protein
MKERLVNICDRLIEFFGWDLEKDEQSWKEKGMRQIHRDEDLKTKVYKAKSNSDNYGLGITSLYNSIEGKRGYTTSFSDYVYANTPADFSNKRIYDLTTYLNIIGELVELYDEWNGSEFSQVISTLQDHEMFGTTKIELDPQIIEHIDDLVVKDKTFKVYKYVDDGDKINANDSFRISKEIYFSQDLTQYLRYIQKQDDFLKCQPKGEVFVTLYGKLDEVHWIYSNWLLTIHKGNSTWLVTDQPNFDNPWQKDMRLNRRSAWRDADYKHDNVDLPYRLFEDQKWLRSNCTDLVNEDTYLTKKVHYYELARNTVQNDTSVSFSGRDNNVEREMIRLFQKDLIKNKFFNAAIEINYEHDMSSYITNARAIQSGRLVGYYDVKGNRATFYRQPEFLKMNISDLLSEEKIFLTVLCNKIIEEISVVDDLPTIELAADFMSRKLIEGGDINPIDTSHMVGWSENAKNIFIEINQTLSNAYGQTIALAPKSYAVALQNTNYNASWLATPQGHESLAEWLILDEEIRPMMNKLRSLDSGIGYRDRDKLLLSLTKHKEKEILSRVFESPCIDVIGLSIGYAPSFTIDAPQGLRQLVTIRNCKDTGSPDMKKGHGIGKDEYQEEICRVCDTTTSKSTRIIQIRHYRGLMWLLGLKHRNELPVYYQNYRAHDHLPYGGNSLLNQTHPYLRMVKNDPCSRHNSNGISILVYTCGRCKNKMLKDKSKEVIINLDEKTHDTSTYNKVY